MDIKYYLRLDIEPNLMASIRVYEVDPRKRGGAGSIEAVKMRNFDTGQLDPVKGGAIMMGKLQSTIRRLWRT